MAKFLQARRRPGKPKKKKQWTAKKSQASSCDSMQLTEQADEKLAWYWKLTAFIWFTLSNIRTTVKSYIYSCVYSIMNPFISLYFWSYNSVKRRINLLKNTIAPSLICQRELRTLRKRLHKLEIEFLKLQLSLPDKGTNQLESGNSICRSCQQATTACCIKAPIRQTAEECILPSLPPSVPPPPPPLPPPPPPIPPPPPALPFKNGLPILKKVGSTRPPKAPVKSDGPLQITIKDLLNVKLRNAKENNDVRKTVAHKYEGMPQITVSALKGVSLKSASKMPPRRLAHVFKDTRNKSPLDLRRHLRKVNMVRSPGGTPIYDRDNKENGTGLTPLMTKALRQKFQMAHPKSPSPLRMSPGNQCHEEA